MKTLFRTLASKDWAKQLFYGACMAAFYGIICWASGWSLLVAMIATGLVAGMKEHYEYDQTGVFSWRNFLLMIVPVLILYVIFNN